MLSIADASQRERAAAAAVGSLPKHLAKDVREQTRADVVPMARREAARRAPDDVSRRIAGRGRLSVWRGIPGIAFGGTAAATSTGTPGREIVRGLELGSTGDRWWTFTRRGRTGGTERVTRRNTRQFMPDASGGRFITPAAEAIADDVLEAWTALVEDAAVAALDTGA